MRFLELEIEAFQAIASAKLAFAPGLNVLFGPNDLGKSTVVTALRAALLLPVKSSAADPFVPWYRDAVPQVTLTFEDDDGRRWRVMKRFGARPAAELRTSKDGATWAVEATGRQVDEVLRAQLSWGVPPPGAKGGKGLPEAFLMNVLLAGQADVDAIFDAGVDRDSDESGRARLSKALAALAQDPLFKDVLNLSQAQLATYFTETGKRRGGAKSPFTAVGEQVSRLTSELAEVAKRLDQSAALEAHVAGLRERVALAKAHEAEAEALLRHARAAFEQASHRATAERHLEDLEAQLAAFDGLVATARAAEADVASLEAALATALSQRADAEQRAARADALIVEAEAAVQRASSADGAQARALRRATLLQQQAELNRQRAAKAAELEAAQRRAQAVAVQARASADAAAARTALASLEGRLVELEAAHASAQQEVALARAIVDFGRWREAATGAELAEARRREAEELDAAAARTSEQVKLELTRVDEALEAKRVKLPDAATLRAIDELERQLKVAEAAIGGGVTVAVRPNEPVRLHAEVDDEAPVDEAVSRERVFDAERKLALSIGKMLEIEVTAGSKEHRRLRDSLARRWRSEGLPVLAEAGVESVAALRELLERVQRERDGLNARRVEAQRLEAEAAAQRQRAQLLRERSEAEQPSALEARAARIPSEQRAVLERLFETLGADWERQADALRAQHEASVVALSKTLTDARGERARQLERVVHLDAAAQAPLPGPTEDVASLERALSACAAELDRVEAALAAVEHEQGAELSVAEQAVTRARADAALARGALAAATERVEGARAAVSERRGQLRAQQDQLASSDRPRLAQRRDEALAAVAPFRGEPAVSQAQLLEAERVLELARAERARAEADFFQADGALSEVGGPDARERVAQVTEAVTVAKHREAELELDAAAWRLLHETLRASENAEGQHLGRALAGPVSAQLAELTHGRYGAVALEADLKTATVGATGTQVDGATVLGALSVGTRDQLATLMRLAIARQLRSALVLDDHLVHTDPKRLSWFLETLRATARTTQVLVFTCRPTDYLGPTVPSERAVTDWPGGLVRSADLGRLIESWPERSRPAKP